MLSPEENLLLALCRLEFNKEQLSNLKDLTDKCQDWDRFVNLANNHGIIGITAYNLKETNLKLFIPENIFKQLNDGLMQSVIRNAWLTERWKEVNEVLKHAGFKHLLLKGMALEHTVYGSRGLRQMTDNDILVKREHALDAWNLLQFSGFKPYNIKSRLHLKILPDLGKHLPTLVRDGYAVEIHSRLFNDEGKNALLNDAIDNAVEIKVDGSPAFILNSDLHLDYLAEHKQEHEAFSGSELKLALDISLLKNDNYNSINENTIISASKSKISGHRKKVFKQQFYRLPLKSRFRFLAGEILPAVNWMEQRHGCSLPKVIIYYPRRIGKLLWLLRK